MGSSGQPAENCNMTDSQKLDKLLAGFVNLQEQYDNIRSDHEILREECRLLREENLRLRRSLATMSSNRGENYSHCEKLLCEIEELKDIVSTSHLELERQREELETKNAKLAQALEQLTKEKDKKCPCLTCKFLGWLKSK